MTSPVTLSSMSAMPIGLYTSAQIYAIEEAWFAQGNDSYALMQQAAWQIARHIEALHDHRVSDYHHLAHYDLQPVAPDCHKRYNARPHSVSVWVGAGNNGGDGWLVAAYLQQAGWRVCVIDVAADSSDSALSNSGTQRSDSDAQKAQQRARLSDCGYLAFADLMAAGGYHQGVDTEVYVDAMFGIGLNRAPTGKYKAAIDAFNHAAQRYQARVMAIDIPSGLVASTGQVFAHCAVRAEVTLCLIARKLGLHIKDGRDYSGTVIDIPLIPYQGVTPSATLLRQAGSVPQRRQNTYKGSFGHVLIIGGNRIDGSQGMGGAAILAASSTMATGAGKITVACHQDFHGALLTTLPDAMTIDLQDRQGVTALMTQADTLAIGMGLGRDQPSQQLFIDYLQAAMSQHMAIVIDADGLYHLAALQRAQHDVVTQLQRYSSANAVYVTPHSGEAALLLDMAIDDIEGDRLAALTRCANIYGGQWLLKGTGTMVLEHGAVSVCATGNAGLASAGMGDVLAGVVAGMLSQQDWREATPRLLTQAVLIHGSAADLLVNKSATATHEDTGTHGDVRTRRELRFAIGQRGLQAQDMPAAIRHVIDRLSA